MGSTVIDDGDFISFKDVIRVDPKQIALLFVVVIVDNSFVLLLPFLLKSMLGAVQPPHSHTGPPSTLLKFRGAFSAESGVSRRCPVPHDVLL